MKDFFKSVLATVVGLLAFNALLAFFLFIGFIGMMIGGSSSTPEVSGNSVLVISLNGILNDQSDNNPVSIISQNKISVLSIDELLKAVKAAKSNDNVKGIYLEGGTLDADLAQLQEVRNAFNDFKKSGKKIAAYADTYTEGAYYLASVADKMWLNPEGMIDWHGLASQTEYDKGLYDKLGIRFQIMKVGKFKSYTEQFTEEKMSPANREQLQRLIDVSWQNILSEVSKSKKISTDSLNSYANGISIFNDPATLKNRGLIDGFLYHDEVKEKVKQLMGIDKDDDINQVSVSDMAANDTNDSGKEIAVYYASGEIVRTDAQGILGGGNVIAADDVCADLEDLANNDDVKAVVIRINSGGGDAFASEQLWRAVSQLKRKKPVVISMSGMAASGAYYTSVAANWLVAEPNTVTGSIGIFAAIPEFSELATQKLGLKFDAVRTNDHSDFGNLLARPFDKVELEAIQGFVNRGYALFRKRVSEGRNMTVAKVENVAQGRVWIGNDALKIGLVDQLGGLNDAVAKAAQLAKVDEYYTVNYPSDVDFLDQLLGNSDRQSLLDEQMRQVLGDFYPDIMALRNVSTTSVLKASIPYRFTIK